MDSPSYLVRDQNGVWYFRYNYPLWARIADPTLPKSIKLSLKTEQKTVAYFRAKSLWLKCWHELQNRRGKSRLGTQTSISVKEVMKRWRDYIANTEPYIQERHHYGKPEFRIVENAVEEQVGLLDHWGLTAVLDTDEFSNLDPLYERAVDAAEQQKELAADGIVSGKLYGQSDFSGSTQSTAVEVGSIQKLSKLFAEYETKKLEDRDWKPKTIETNRRRFDFLISVLGDIDARRLSKAHVVEFRSALEKKTKKRRNGEESISPVSKNQYLETCKAVLNYAVNVHDSIKENPFDNPIWKYAVKKADKKPRVYWSEDDLKKMFIHPVFTAGEGMTHPYFYWIPILGLLTGARLNEICSLHVDDVRQELGVNYISINTDHPYKSVKTEGSSRIVPVHKKLVELGFLEFVTYMRQRKYAFVDDDGYTRLWRGVIPHNGNYGKYVSSWFNANELSSNGHPKGFRHKFGIDFSEDESKDFHALRHTFSTMAGQQGMERATRHQLTGHTLDEIKRSVGDGYDHGKTLKMLDDAVQKLDFDHVLPSVKPFFDLVSPNILRGKIKSK